MSTKHRRLLPATLFVILIAATALAFVSARTRTSPHESITATSQAQTLQDGRVIGQSGRRRGESVQTVRFALYDVGILPRTARAAPGWVALHLEDASGGGASDLVVERIEGGEGRGRGEAVGRVRRQRETGYARRVREEIRLTEGRYRLSLADNPDINAELIVER